MPFNFADCKVLVRRVVQDTLGVQAFYQDDSLITPVPVRARFRNKMKRMGELNDDGYSEVIEGIEQIILIPSDYPDVKFKQGGQLTIPEYRLSLTLDVLEPVTGPLTEVWHVSRS
jgi:hypothetical protein